MVISGAGPGVRGGQIHTSVGIGGGMHHPLHRRGTLGPVPTLQPPRTHLPLELASVGVDPFVDLHHAWAASVQLPHALVTRIAQAVQVACSTGGTRDGVKLEGGLVGPVGLDPSPPPAAAPIPSPDSRFTFNVVDPPLTKLQRGLVRRLLLASPIPSPSPSPPPPCHHQLR